jgi:hypothetical protein
MAQNRTWTLTETGQTRSWTLTQSSESKTFSVTPSTATRNFTVSPGVGPTGPNEVSTSTSTDITGILKGDGSTVSAAVADTDYQSVPAEGAFADGDKTKLDGIETAATADQTAAEILTAIKTVDGTGSGLDADTVDGKEAAAFAELATSNDFTATNTFSGGLTVFGVDGTTAGQLRLNSTTLGGGTAITPTGTAFRSISTPDSSGTLALTAQSDGTIQSSDLDFANSTDIGADLADADEVLVSDGGGNTTRRKSALSRFWTYIKAKIESVALSAIEVAGTVTISNGAQSSTLDTDAAGDLNIEPSGDEVAYFTSPGKNVYFNLGQSNTGRSWFRVGQNGSGSSQLLLYDGSTPGVKMAGDEDSYVNGGNLGVGNNSPSAKLDVTGDAKISGDLTVDTDTLHVDSTNNRVGINDAAPSRTLDVVGDAEVSGSFLAANFYKNGGLASNHPSGITCGGNLVMGASDSITFNDNSGTWNGSTIAGDQTMSGDVTMSGDLTVDTDTLHVDSVGNAVGIATTTPDSGYLLHVNGSLSDFKIDDSASIMEMTRNTDNYIHASNASGKISLIAGGSIATARRLQWDGTTLNLRGGVGTWDGSTIAGDQTMSGQLELTGQSATGDDSAMTRSLGDLRWANNPDVHLLGNMYLSDQTTLLFRGTNTGSGSTPQDCSIMTASTGTTTGSTAHFRHSGSNTLIFGKNGSSALGWNFDSKWIFDFRAYINSAATNTDGYLVLGLAVSDTATTQPAAKSCGFRFHDQGLYAFVHNGSSYSESSSSLFTLSATNTPKAYSIHNDDTNIHFYLDGVLVDSITAPTGSTGNNKQGVAFWVDNETTTNDVSLNILGGFRFSNLA